jgi:dienelactone hydrolase
MPTLRTLLVVVFAGAGLAATISAPSPEHGGQVPAAKIVDLKAAGGTVLKASYFAAANPAPGVILVHQVNRTRKSWDDLAAKLAAAGINTLTVDLRGYGESGGNMSDRKVDAGDMDVAFQYLASQPGVKRDTIGLAGAGWLGVDRSVVFASAHPTEVKSLVLLSGETFRDGLQFLHQASQLPILFAMSDDDEYPPTQDAMKLLYVTSSSSSKKFVHYSSAHDAPWLWFETADASKVPAKGGHGTDMLKVHPELADIIADWFVTTLIKTPGHAPADTLASATVINQIQGGNVAQVTQQLMEARKKDPLAQLFPEVTVSIIGQDHMRANEPQRGLEVFELNLLAYPDSANANDDLADAYLALGDKNMARQHAEKTLQILDAHTVPATSWTDTEQYRGEIRSDAQDVLKKLDAGH